MKKIFLLLLANIFLLSFTRTQEPFLQLTQKHFEGGSEKFVKIIYKSIKYPTKARRNCIIGTVNSHIYISNKNIDSITFSSKLEYGIEKAIVSSIQETAGKWTNTKPIKLDILFGFNIGFNDDVKGDFRVTGYSNKMPKCITNKEILADFNKYIKKKKYKKAKKSVEKLLRRDPHSTHFNGLYQYVNNKIAEQKK